MYVNKSVELAQREIALQKIYVSLLLLLRDSLYRSFGTYLCNNGNDVTKICRAPHLLSSMKNYIIYIFCVLFCLAADLFVELAITLG